MTLTLIPLTKINFKWIAGDFAGGSVVKNLPSNAGDAGLIPGQGTKFPHAVEQLRSNATTTELACLNERARVPQTTEPTRPGAQAPQLERENPHATTNSPCRKEKIPHASMKIPHATTKTRRSQKIKKINF